MTPEHMAKYGDILSRGDQADKKILILGATPELRILAASMGAEVVCADFSLPMLEHMGGIVEKKMKGAVAREVWFKGDWIDIPFPQNYFSFAMGDLVSPFIAQKDIERFFQKIQRTLKPGGYFITRLHVLDGDIVSRSPEEFFDAFFREHDLGADLKTTLHLLNIKLLDWSWNRATGMTDRRNMIEMVRRYSRSAPADQGTILEAFIKEYSKGVDYYAETENDYENLMKKYFAIESKSIARDYAAPGYLSFYPLFVLKNSNT